MAANTNTNTPAVVELTDALLDSVEARTFTLRNAASGVASAIKSDDKAAAYLAGIRDAVAEHDGVKAVAAAYAIKVGKARGWKQGDVATRIGVSPSMATLYVRMGLAYDKGVVVGSPTWKALMGKAYANDKEVGKVLTDESKSAADVEAAVEDKVKRVAAAESGGDGDGSGGSGNGGSGNGGNGVDVPRGFAQKIAMIEACIAGLPAEPTEPQHQKIEDMLKVVAAYAAPVRKARRVAQAAS